MSFFFERIADAMGNLCSKPPSTSLRKGASTDMAPAAHMADRAGLALDPEVRREGPAADASTALLSSGYPRKASGRLLVSSTGGASVVEWFVDPRPVLEEPLGKDGRQAQPLADGRGAPDVPVLGSQPFVLSTVSARHAWHLLFVPFEFSGDAASVYLISTAEADQQSHVELSFALSTRHPGGHDIRMEMRHVFMPGKDMVWGVQDFIFLSDIPAMVDRDSQLTIRLEVLDASVLATNPTVAPSGAVLGEHRGSDVMLVSESPRMVVIEDFLSPEECQQIRDLAKPLLQRSRVSSGTETKSRTSYGCFFTGNLERHVVVRAVESRLSALLENNAIRRGEDLQVVRKPLFKTESLQAVYYGVGQMYSEHFDNRIGSVHMRAATVIVYVGGDCHEGGATYFPKATPLRGGGGQGIRVFPREGRALVFWSRRVDGSEDPASLHAAEPVLRGRKWIVTRWMREVDDVDMGG